MKAQPRQIRKSSVRLINGLLLRAHMRTLALSQMKKVAHVVPVATNIIFFDIVEGGPDELELTNLAKEAGIIIGPYGGGRIRILTHLDVDREAADALISFLRTQLD